MIGIEAMGMFGLSNLDIVAVVTNTANDLPPIYLRMMLGFSHYFQSKVRISLKKVMGVVLPHRLSFLEYS